MLRTFLVSSILIDDEFMYLYLALAPALALALYAYWRDKYEKSRLESWLFAL